MSVVMNRLDDTRKTRARFPARLRQLARRLPWLRWILFAAAGFLAFIVDMTVLAIAVYGLGVGPALARIPSILAAASAAWYCNRRFTFADTSSRRRWAQWLRYLGVNCVNMTINYASYALLVVHTAFGREHPLLAVWPGAIVGLWVNYLLASRLVFVDAKSNGRSSASDARAQNASPLSQDR